MSRHLALFRQRGVLAEIQGIMTAMKNLSLIELRKLNRLFAQPQRVIATLEAMAADLESFYPLSPSRQPARLVVVLGSERGFCGDFNERLLALAATDEFTESRLVLVGQRLAARYEADPRVVAVLEGAMVTEEAPRVLTRLVQELDRLLPELVLSPTHLGLIGHGSEDDTVQLRRLFPILTPTKLPLFSHPPRLYLAPERLFAALVEHYLFAVLQQWLYNSLLAENRRRLQHLENAIRRLERTTAELERQYQVLRQEEITEEIEVIMLSAEALHLQASGSTRKQPRRHRS
ncbi:MAG TPA: FoF1 ATP synthase subunit gamma [Candidatus Competibacteraceae bacterium]|nr:FoF1 ATP synthase subunit gamma [Candidatus Competibacteraceae bacterium]